MTEKLTCCAGSRDERCKDGCLALARMQSPETFTREDMVGFGNWVLSETDLVGSNSLDASPSHLCEEAMTDKPVADRKRFEAMWREHHYGLLGCSKGEAEFIWNAALAQQPVVASAMMSDEMRECPFCPAMKHANGTKYALCPKVATFLQKMQRTAVSAIRAFLGDEA